MTVEPVAVGDGCPSSHKTLVKTFGDTDELQCGGLVLVVIRLPN